MATEQDIRKALSAVKTPQGEGLDRSSYLQGLCDVAMRSR